MRIEQTGIIDREQRGSASTTITPIRITSITWYKSQLRTEYIYMY